MRSNKRNSSTVLTKSNNLLDKYDSNGLSDQELLELESLLQDEMYVKSEHSLFEFYKNFWTCHDPSKLHTSWVQECVAEHIEAALRRDIRRLTISIPPRQGKTKAAGTLLLMEDGTPRKIEDIRIGDNVLAFDTNTRTHGSRQIVNFWDEGLKEFYKVTLRDGQTVVCTQDHRLYTDTGYKTLSELKVGSRISIANNYKSALSTANIFSVPASSYAESDELTLLALWLLQDIKYKDKGIFYITKPEIFNHFQSIVTNMGFTIDVESFQHYLVSGNSSNGEDFIAFINTIYSTTFNYRGYTFQEVPTYLPDSCFRLSQGALVYFLSILISYKGRIGKDSLSIRFRSELLIDNLVTLFNQLGFMCRKRYRAAKGDMPEEWEVFLIGHINTTKLIQLFNGILLVNNDKIANLVDRGVYLDEEPYINEEYWVRIKKIEYVGELPGYDVEVSKLNNFVLSNGIHSHNSTMSISAICHHWIKNPWEKFWLVSHSSKLFVQNIVLTRRIMEHPLYRDRWMNKDLQDYYSFTLSKDVNTKTRVENDTGGYILGGSPSSGALGMGYSVAFLDDVLDSEEANSNEAVEKVNNWYTQTFLNRSNDVNTDVQIIVMQRLRGNDIIDYVNKTYGDQDWFNLVLPAKYDPKRIWFSPIGFNDPRKFKNELLDPVRLPDSFLAAQAKNQIIYNTRYQQNPTADGGGNMIQKDWIVEVDKLPTVYDQMLTVWDLSFGDSPKSSFSVGLVLGVREGRFYCIDMIRDRMEVPEQVDSIRALKEKYPRSQIAVEKRANGNAALSLLKREINDIYAFQPRLFGGSKEQRLSATLPYFRDKLVSVYSPFTVDLSRHSTYDANVIIDELISFPLGAEDDIVDCFGYGLQWLAEFGKENMAIITAGKELILPDEMGGVDIYLRGHEYKQDEYFGQFEYEMFGGNTSRSSLIDLQF